MAAPLTKLFVGNLPEGCTNEELRTLFERCGTVAECDVINEYGFVHMSNPEEAEKAINCLSNSNYRGSYLSVERSKSKRHPEPGAPGRARGVMPVMSRDGYDGDGPPHGLFGNGFNRSEGPPFADRGDFSPVRHGGGMGRRMRPIPYDWLSMTPPRDPNRSSSVGMSRDPSAPPEDIYNGRATAYPSTNDYLSSRRSPPLQESSANRGSSICLPDVRSSSSPEIIYQKINLGSDREHFPMDRSRALENRSSSRLSDDHSSSSPKIVYQKINIGSHRERFPMDRSRAYERRSSSCSYDGSASSSEPTSSRRKIFRSHREHSPMDRSLIATSKIVPERSARAREKERRSSFCSSDDRSRSSKPLKIFRSKRKRSPMDRSRSRESRLSSCSYDGRASLSISSSTRKKYRGSRRERSPMDRSKDGERRSSSCSYDDRASSSEPISSRRKISRSRSERSPMDRSRAVERRSSSCSYDGRASLSVSSSTRKKYRGSRREHSPMDRSLIATSKIVPERSARAREKERRSICSSDDRSRSSSGSSYSKKSPPLPRKLHRSPSPGPSRKRENYPDQVTNYHDFKKAASKIIPQRSARAREKERRSSIGSSDDRSSSSPEPSYTEGY